MITKLTMNRLASSVLLSMALAAFLMACGSGAATTPEYPPETVAEGNELFVRNCSACHGPDARGVTGLGKDMTTSEFIQGLGDMELQEFIKTGRPVGDPSNTTGVAMPPNGGNPDLTDDQIQSIIAYIRSVQQ